MELYTELLIKKVGDSFLYIPNGQTLGFGISKGYLTWNETSQNMQIVEEGRSLRPKVKLDDITVQVEDGALETFTTFNEFENRLIALKNPLVNFNSGGATPTNFIEVTLSEIQTLISTSTLTIGATYKILGIDLNWCDGYFKAITTNQLDFNGLGLFFNPNYSLYQNWKNFFDCTTTIVSGTPTLNEEFTDGDGNTFIYLTPELGRYNGTSLPDADYTGTGGAVVNLSSNSLVTYAEDDIVIWGNKHWINLTGEIGSSIDELTLDATNWEETTLNLIPTVDEIFYDITNDWISNRKDALSNDISITWQQNQDNSGYSFNPLKTFKWGNISNYSNKINLWEGVTCNLNFYLNNNTGSGFQLSNNTGNYFQLSNNTGNSFNLYNNTGSGFYLYNNKGNDFNLSSNTGNSFNLYNNTGSGFYLNNNTGDNFYLNNNTGTSFQLSDTAGNDFNLSSNMGNDFNLYNNTGSGFYLNNNTGDDFYLNNKDLTSKTIYFCDFKNITIDSGVDISASTVLFALYGKSIFRNSSNAQIITYVNGSNVLTVVDIED